MLVRDYMSAKVIVVERQCSVAGARTLLRKHRIRQVPIVEKDRLVGILTDRDLRSASGTTKTVAQIMTAKPTSIGPNAPIDEAARVLRALKVGALPVLENRRVIGVITVSDVMDAFVEFCGVTEPTYYMILTGSDGREAKWRIRRVLGHKRADLKWIHRERQSGKVHLRLRTSHIDDVVSALEADGFDVSTILSPARRPHG